MKKRFKKGAASFYIVAFSTLILVVIATSFATIILSEISRTANDDLSQSAYDSALAGVEDAKVAYSNYRRCKEAGYSAAASKPSGTGAVTCPEIIWWVEKDTNETSKCAMVGHILGKISKNQSGEVEIGGVKKTGSTETTTNQAYTCVIINTDLKDYRTTLTRDKKVQTLRTSMGNTNANAATKIKISWYSVTKFKDNTLGGYAGFVNNATGKRVIFPQLTSTIAAPPMVELQIVQTGASFSLKDFDITSGNTTNRATLFLVPNSSTTTAGTGNTGNNYIGTWNGSANVVKTADVVKTNNHMISNKAFLVYCSTNPSTEFYCNAEIELPGVIGGGSRNNNTFMLSIALPYQRPNTDFSIELCNSSGCNAPVLNNVETTISNDSGVKKISNAQIAIDSTGRANDLYRRVETRLESADTSFGTSYPYYPLEVLADGITKTITTSYEGYFRF